MDYVIHQWVQKGFISAYNIAKQGFVRLMEADIIIGEHILLIRYCAS